MNFAANGYLVPGLHDATVSEINQYLVQAFAMSNTRPIIFDGYKKHKVALEAINVPFEQFLDGSFVSTKTDPNDVDMVCFADKDLIDNLPMAEKQILSTLVSGKTTQATYHCDAYFAPTVPPGHPFFDRLRPVRKYWMGEFGFDRADVPKGIIKVEIVASPVPAVTPGTPGLSSPPPTPTPNP